MNWEFLCRNIKQVVLESISGQNKNSDRQKERFRSPIGIGVGVTIYTTVFLLKAKILLWSSGKGKGKGWTQEGHSKVIYGWWMVDGGIPFPDALH